jgi:hypothetical protein
MPRRVIDLLSGWGTLLGSLEASSLVCYVGSLA